jgi:hypothetical protein
VVAAAPRNAMRPPMQKPTMPKREVSAVAHQVTSQSPAVTRVTH